MQVSKNFILQEFIDPDIYAIRADKSIELIDPRIVGMAQFIRDYFGQPVTINNWHEGGPRKESGLRKFLTTTGSKFSQHKFGRAIDMVIRDVDPENARKEIIKYWDKFRTCGITTIEEATPTWLHCDCRFTGTDRLVLIPYTT